MLKNLLLLVVTCLLCFAALEMYVKLRYPQDSGYWRATLLPNHRILHHTWKPGKHRTNARNYPYDIHVNKQGWIEDYDVSEAKPENTYRIFYIGDSNTQSVVPKELSMVQLVENALNEKIGNKINIRFEVINTGTSSYSTEIYYLLLKKYLLGYDPDLIVINLDMTDISNDYSYRRLALYDEKGELEAITPSSPEVTRFLLTPEGPVSIEERSPLIRFFIKHSALISHIDKHITYLGWQNKLADNNREKHVDGSANWLTHEWTPAIRGNVELSMQRLLKIVQLATDNDVKIMVSGVPFYYQYTGQYSREPHATLKKTLSGTPAKFLNSYQEIKSKFSDDEIKTLYWESDPTHFNVRGNKEWSIIQLDFLLDPEYLLLPAY